jgi:2-polyprenyl-3-methyl-5-hydroxy-6-metoxy-1,4-benzoquinol methylase
MLLADGTTLSKENIEQLNAHGPYSMAVWKSGDMSIGNEEGLAGRSNYFLDLIRKEILKNFSLEEIKNLSILDIGCNDGWVLHNLSDLPFKKMVGIEPRQKNIDKGKLVRKLLKLDNNVVYKLGTIEDLGDQTYDIVICAGVLYHVESIPIALKNIRKACKKMIFVESRCISSRYITKELESEIEMRDLAYFFNKNICGVTAQKYESAYYDGSSAFSTVVNVPTTETLIMHLNVVGFDNITVVVDEQKYRNDVWQDKRPLSGVCLTAFIENDKKEIADEETNWINGYERGLKDTILPFQYIKNLYSLICLSSNIDLSNNNNLKNTYEYLKTKNVEQFDSSKCNPIIELDKYSSEIIKNFIYSPFDKISLEYGKSLNKKGDFIKAIEVIKGVTEKTNSDWRSVYRGFHLLVSIYKTLGDTEKINFYSELASKSNSKYKVEV